MNTNVKKRCQALNKAFGSRKFLERLIKEMGNIEVVRDYLPRIFQYYFITADHNTQYSFEDINNLLCYIYNGNNDYLDEVPKGKRGGIKNIKKSYPLDKLYFFQAFNGIYEESYIKYGLDNIEGLSEEIKEAFATLEKYIEKSHYPLAGKFSKRETKSYLTLSPYTAIKYALLCSPERLWCGPIGLFDASDQIGIPIIIGETKVEYIKRLLYEKLAQKNLETSFDPDTKKKIENSIEIVSEAFGSMRPRIAIIPEENVNKLKANYGNFIQGITQFSTLEELVESIKESWRYQIDVSDLNFSDDHGISVYGKVPCEKDLIIQLPDYFELAQINAIQKGAKIGDYVFPTDGSIIKHSRQMIKAEESKMPQFLKKIINKITYKSKDSYEQSAESQQENVIDKGPIYLGGTGRMNLCEVDGKEYLFKPSVDKGTNNIKKYRLEAQLLGYEMQKLINPENSVECKKTILNGEIGSLQPKIKHDDEKTNQIEEYYFGITSLDPQIAEQFMREFVVDYCLCNYDSHYGNFFVDTNGKLHGIDKEQALRYVNDSESQDDLLLSKYSPNEMYGEYPPIYAKIFEDVKSGALPVSILKEAIKAVKRLQTVPKEKLIGMYDNYINAVVEEIGISREIVEKNIEKRIENLSELEKMLKEIKNEKELSITDLIKVLKKSKSNKKEKKIEEKHLQSKRDEEK